MTSAAMDTAVEPRDRPTRMLVIATLLCSYPGIDATGQAHMEYPPNTYVIPTPDPVMFPESFYLYCFEQGIDAIVIASCGTDSPYEGSFDQLAKQVDRTYVLMKERGIDIRRLKLTAICSVCTKAFIKEIAEMEAVLEDLGPVGPSRPSTGAGRGGRSMTADIPTAADYDVLVVGGGIAGLQTALDLADRGRTVLVVEKEPSIGGKMIALSKVFPTMDCASLHHHATDVQRCPPRQRRRLGLLGGRAADARPGRRLQRHHPAQGDLRRRGHLHRLSAVRVRLPGGGAARVRGQDGRASRGLHPLRHGHPAERAHRRRSVHLLRQVREGLPHHPHRHRLRPGGPDRDTAFRRGRAGHRLPDHADRGQGRVSRRGLQRPERPRHGAAALAQRPLRSRPAAIGWQDPRSRGLCAVRRLTRRDPGRALLLARLLHVRHQAGDAPLRLAAAGRHHHLLHGHPLVRQGLRAVLSNGPGHGHRVRQGQGRSHRRASER